MPKNKPLRRKHELASRSTRSVQFGKKTAEKSKISRLSQPNTVVHLNKSYGLLDLHFHGAFGIDLMRADEDQLNQLSMRLLEHGVAAFCPTTLTDSHETLLGTLSRLGNWILHFRQTRSLGATPLGIHLEGPFLAPSAAGAHPAPSIQAFSLPRLEEYWLASQKTLKIITLAPEVIKDSDFSTLVTWARKRKIQLSAGHTRCTQAQAQHAFDAGFSRVTHAWNALAFHHREPGVLGAALGRENLFVELIADGVHVSDTVAQWTMDLHGSSRSSGVVLVSDAAPATGLPQGEPCSFGSLKVHFDGSACRTADGTLAGGGHLLPALLERWFKRSIEKKRYQRAPQLRALFKELHTYCFENPLASLELSAKELPKLGSSKTGTWIWTWPRNIKEKGHLDFKLI